jgi:hypothetical protein
MQARSLLPLFVAIGAYTAFAQEPSTWQTIQTQIFNQQCTSCHAAGTYFAQQSGLILTADVAYSQLINVAPKNAAAAGDGLLRVGTQGLASLYKSFLWEKINAPDQEHFYRDHPQYGSLMPLGAPPLTNGELEFIRRWIVAGAPQNGAVVDRAVLQDTTRYQPPAFAPLPKPANGIQLQLGPFDVAPNFERELFSYALLNNDKDIFIERVEIAMRPASHHFILYTFQESTPSFVIPLPNVMRDIRDASGNYIRANMLPMAFHKFVAGTQWPLLNYHFPPGVALRLPAKTGLDMNSHYANRSTSTIPGEIYANLHFADPAKVQHVAEILQLSNQDISLPPRKVTTLTKTFTFTERQHIFQLFSHAHEHMTEFKVEVVGGPRNGEVVYVAYDWVHPPILKIDPPLVLEPQQGLKLIVTYNNWTDRELKFGLLSEDEMMILFGYYYKTSTTAVADQNTATPPRIFALEQNFPNPFSANGAAATAIRYSLPQPADIELAVYDISGRLIESLAQGRKTAGSHQVVWNAPNLPSGIYFVKLRAGKFQAARKIILFP